MLIRISAARASAQLSSAHVRLRQRRRCFAVAEAIKVSSETTTSYQHSKSLLTVAVSLRCAVRPGWAGLGAAAPGNPEQRVCMEQSMMPYRAPPIIIRSVMDPHNRTAF